MRDDIDGSVCNLEETNNDGWPKIGVVRRMIELENEDESMKEIITRHTMTRLEYEQMETKDNTTTYNHTHDEDDDNNNNNDDDNKYNHNQNQEEANNQEEEGWTKSKRTQKRERYWANKKERIARKNEKP